MNDARTTRTSDITLRRTSTACPEQYDAYIGDRQVGYLRMRHGAFRVDCPKCGGDTVYRAYPDGDGDFEDHEREGFLTVAKVEIIQWLKRESDPPVAASDAVNTALRVRET